MFLAAIVLLAVVAVVFIAVKVYIHRLKRNTLGILLSLVWPMIKGSRKLFDQFLGKIKQ